MYFPPPTSKAHLPPYIAAQRPAENAIKALVKEDLNALQPGKPITLDIVLTNSISDAPTSGLDVAASLSMPSMAGMDIPRPSVVPGGKPGHYSVTFTLPHAGAYVLRLTIGKSPPIMLDLAARESGSEMKMEMKATLGDWSASREGSGTAWQPDSSPMFMRMLPSAGGFELSTMGTVQAGYVDAGGKRGGKGFFSDSMIMLMARRETGGGTLGLHFMTSLDPIINGEDGVPDLFQTGESAHGIPLVDRQHPHNLFSEVAASYSHPVGRDWTVFGYGGPVGEPALGNVMFMHRPSGLEVPEAPISHHWFDSTHISFGVVTGGVVYRNRWKAEGSFFNGHEPGENRYTIGPVGLNSASGRLSYNPSRDWSFSGSFGFIDSPEALSPGIDEHRLTASVAYSHDFPGGDALSATAYFGRDIVEGTSTPSDAWLTEATLYHHREAIFGRFERVEKDDLFNVPPGNYTISKFVFGDVHTLSRRDGFDFGIGAYAGIYAFPGSLTGLYGRGPVTFGVFFRVRPGAM